MRAEGVTPPPGAIDVLVVGEAVMDIVQTADACVEHVGGSPANVALGLGRRGIAVGLFSQIGDDARGQRIVAHLTASGVHILDESMTTSPTSTALARIAAGGHAEYDFEVRWRALGSAPAGVTPRVLHTGSVAAFLEPGASSVRDLLRRSRAAEITFDPNIRAGLLGPRDEVVGAFEETARMSTVVKLSDEDAAWLYPGLSADAVIDRLLSLGPQVVAMTLGDRGAMIANAGDRVSVRARDVAPVDTIGAGDTFMASLIHAVLDGGSAGLDRARLRRICQDAVDAAAVTVSRSGADLPWASEL